jgi:hypothetical protein
MASGGGVTQVYPGSVKRTLTALVLCAATLAANDVVFLHGQVTLQDGAPPPKSVTILLLCKGSESVRQTYTGKDGKFYLKVERDDFNHVARALPNTTTEVGDAGLAGNCAVAGDLKGYESTRVDLATFTIGEDLLLPKIVLKPKK